MSFMLKLVLTNIVIIGCAQIGKRFPSTAGLIATMPITSLAVLLWLHSDTPSNSRMIDYTRGVLWGIIPTILFFAAALFCFRRGMAIQTAIAAGFAVWIAGAALHQWLVR
jgi:uncharacterized membrane protein (GlpM family)